MTRFECSAFSGPCYAKWPVNFLELLSAENYSVVPHCPEGNVQIPSQVLLLHIHHFSGMNLLLGPGQDPEFLFSAWFIPAFLFLAMLRAFWKVKRLVMEPDLSTVEIIREITLLEIDQEKTVSLLKMTNIMKWICIPCHWLVAAWGRSFFWCSWAN